MLVEAEMKSVGSIWRKWDLHVHTPASFIWKGGKKLRDQTTTERDDTCRSILERMGALDVAAFCIMDYWTFDGFLELRDYFRRNPTAPVKRVFPGIELRLEAPTDYRLNTHVLFDDLVSNERLGHFLAHLKLGGPQGRPPSRENFIEIAKSYDPGKLKHHGMTVADRADDEKMFHLGLSTAVVTRESLHQAIEIVGDEHSLIVQPYDTSDGLEDLDWKRHPYCSHGCRDTPPAVVLRQLACREDAGGDQQHALATLVHAKNLASSPFVRLRDMLFQPVLD